MPVVPPCRCIRACTTQVYRGNGDDAGKLMVRVRWLWRKGDLPASAAEALNKADPSDDPRQARRLLTNE